MNPTQQEPLVSIVIPCYNCSRFLDQTLQCIRSQVWKNIEVILIDDASSDDYSQTLVSITEFPLIYKRLDKNSGPGIARRIGQELAHGSYIQFLDADDYIHPEKISRSVQLMEQRTNLLMCYAHTEYTDENLIPTGRTLSLTDAQFTSILPHHLKRTVWQTSSCLWRTSFLHREYWHDLRVCEDILFDWLHGLAQRPIGKVESTTALVYKRLHTASVSSGIANHLNHQKEILKCYQIFLNELKASNSIVHKSELLSLFAQKFSEKTFTFLRLGDTPSAKLCMDTAHQLDTKSLDMFEKVFYHIQSFTNSEHIWPLLRKYYWAGKWWRKKVAVK